MPLRKYLHMAKRATDAICQDCKAPNAAFEEDRAHVLTECAAWKDEREKWYQELSEFFTKHQLKASYESIKRDLPHKEFALFLLGGCVNEQLYGAVNKHRAGVALIACEAMGAILRARAKAAAARP